MRSVPFLTMHLLGLSIFLVRFHWYYVAGTIAIYYVRMFFVTAGYHRYFSHRAFRTSRTAQFLLAFAAQSSAQKGVLWWSSWHRVHHRVSDTPRDVHSPVAHTFFHSHVGWIMRSGTNRTRTREIPDFVKFPELVWLNTWYLLPPIVLAVSIFWSGILATGSVYGGIGFLTWGFFLNTVLLWHGSFCINSLAHRFGTRRHETEDQSRNSILLYAVNGESWHNNHHRYPGMANQGMAPWEIDVTYWTLLLLSKLGLVWSLRPQPRLPLLAYTA